MTSSTSRAVATPAINMGIGARVSVGWGDRGGGRGHRGTRAARDGWKQRRRRRERGGARGFGGGFGGPVEKLPRKGKVKDKGKWDFFFDKDGEPFFFWLEQNKDGEVGLLSRQTLQHVNVFPLKKHVNVFIAHPKTGMGSSSSVELERCERP